jgi:hypothetical protein
MYKFIVYYGETSRTVEASSANRALTIVQDEYEYEWGPGTFDQYEVRIEREDEDEVA